MMRLLPSLVTILVAAALFAADDGFAPYESIVERAPFGKAPSDFDPSKPGSGSARGGKDGQSEEEIARSVEEQQLLSSVRVCALNGSPEGDVYVGFIDSSDKTAKNYYLKLHESKDGWSFDSVDGATRKVTLTKNGVSVELGLGEGSGKSKPSNGKKPGIITPAASGDKPYALLGGRRALRSRRQEREAQEQARAAELDRREKLMEERRREEEAREAERKAQTQEIRENLASLAEQLARARAEKESAKKEAEEQAQDNPAE